MLKHQNIHSKNNFHKVSFYFLVEVLKIIDTIILPYRIEGILSI